MALPQTIGTSLEVSNTGYAGPFRASNGDHYVVLQVTSNKDVVAVYKADNGDNAWSEQDSSNRPISGTVTDRQGLCATLVGTTIHIATWGSSGSNRYVHYHAFSTSSDTWTTTEEAVAGPFSANTGDGTVSIEVRSDGDKIIWYQGPYEAIHTSNYDRIYYAVHQGTGWSDASGFLQTGQTKQYRHVYTVMGASDKVHVFYSNESNTEVEHVSFDSSNTVSAVEVVTTTSSANPLSRPFYFDDGGAETIIVGIMQGTTAYRYSVVNDGTPGGGEAVSDVAVHQDFAGAHRSFGIGADANTGKEYLAYVDSSTQDLWYDTRESGSWGTDVEELDAITGKRLCVNVYVIDSGDTVLAYVYNDNATIKYHETVIAAGGTGYTQSAAGSLTPSGALDLKIGKAVAGALAPSAALVKKTSISTEGSITPSGSLVKKAIKSFAGSLTPSGALNAIKVAQQAVAGAIAPAGTLAIKTLKAVAGNVTPSGTARFKTLKALAGSITPTGALNAVKTGVVQQAVAGVLAPAGALVVKVGKAVSGAVVPAGDVAKSTSISIAGVIAPTGALVRKAGKALAGSVPMAGVVATVISKAYNAAGSLPMAGALVRKVYRALEGTIDPQGAVSKQIARTLAGTLGLSGALGVAQNQQAVSGVLVMSGALSAVYIQSPVGYGKQAPAYVTPRVSWDDNDTVTYDEHRIRDIGKADKFVSYSTRKGGV